MSDKNKELEVPVFFESEEQGNEIFDNLVWMNSVEAAKYLRKTVGALRTAVNRGQLRCRKWRRRLYFKRTELNRLLDGSFYEGGK